MDKSMIELKQLIINNLYKTFSDSNQFDNVAFNYEGLAKLLEALDQL